MNEKIKVGSRVRLRDGREGTVTDVRADGSKLIVTDSADGSTIETPATEAEAIAGAEGAEDTSAEGADPAT